MTAPPPAGSPDHVPTQECPRCHDAVPVGVFCGRCGADMTRPQSDRFVVLRPQTYVAAPREQVLVPMITSTLFPELFQEYRNPYRIGMAIMLAGVVVLSFLGWLAPLIALVALGVPALFMLYLWQSGALHDVPVGWLTAAAALGAGCGVGWVWFTGAVVARAYGVPMAAGFLLEDLAGIGLVFAVGGAILMVLPAVVIRVLMRRRPRESLDGFSIGALGALSFTAAGTTTRLAPQLVAGLLENVLPIRRFTGAVLFGIAAPLTAAALGGLIGILLWFRPGPIARRHRGRVRAVLLVFTLLVVVIYTAIWLIDDSPLSRWPQLGLHILMTVIALIVTRYGVQLALLHEQQDPPSCQPVLCANCDRVVPEMAFCPACGLASHALSRTARRQRRASPPARRHPTTSTDV